MKRRTQKARTLITEERKRPMTFKKEHSPPKLGI